MTSSRTTQRASARRPGAPAGGRRRPARRRRTSAAVRRRRWGCVGSMLVAAAVMLGLLAAMMTGVTSLPALGRDSESGPRDITGPEQPDRVPWSGAQPDHGVDISFPQCGRTLRDLAEGYAIVGLDGGMPNRPNPCFASQWRFATQQSGAAVYVNTADNGRGDPLDVGRRAAEGDLEALRGHGIEPGTPVWLDVELPEVWRGSQARHRAVIAEHLRVLAAAGYPVGVYSAPALWEQITGGARLDVPTWLGIGRASAERAAAACQRRSFGGRTPDIVQRIGTGSDGRPLDRNRTCPGTDLTGLVRPT